jgi:hypothetical protein
MQLRYTYNNVESTWGGNIQQLLSWPRDKQITVISSLVRDRNKAWVTFNSERRRREFEVTMTRYYLTPRQDTQQTGETGESSDFVLKQALEGFGLKMSSTNEESYILP